MEKVILKVLQESLKKSNDAVKWIMQTIPYVHKAVEFATRLETHDLSTPLSQDIKLELGWYMREAGHRWDAIFMLALAQDYFNTHYKGQDLSKFSSDYDLNLEDLEQLIAKYTHFNSLLKNEHLADMHQVKVLLDGKEICDIYGIKPGKAIKFIMDEQLSYQILNREAGREQVMKYIVENKDAFLAKYNK